MSEPIISRATKNDYSELIQLWEAAVNTTHGFLTQKDIQQYKLLIHDYYFDRLDLYCIRHAGQIQGFIGLNKDDIQMLFVEPSWARKGIGKALTSFAVNKCRARTVNVNEQNESALNFYQHMGFTVTQRYNHDDAGKPYPVLAMAVR